MLAWLGIRHAVFEEQVKPGKDCITEMEGNIRVTSWASERPISHSLCEMIGNLTCYKEILSIYFVLLCGSHD